MLRHLFSIIMIFVAAVCPAADDVDAIAAKAQRFFNYGEWPNAGAMYSLLIDARPTDAGVYGHAIVVAAMQGDTVHQVDLTHRALKALVPVDSIFASVERTSFTVGQTSLYRDYLTVMKHAEPWLTRTVNGYLLRYYTYRRNAPGMIEMSIEMLRGLPDDEKFLYPLAQGYLMTGDYDKAMAAYSRIVNVNPKAYEALLYLGNFYASRAEADATSRAMAVDYLRRAAEIKSTPVVSETLRSLTSGN